MNVNIKLLVGDWDLGFSLDQHIVKSTYVGDDDNGNAQYETLRTEIGEALYQLKYKNDQSKVDIIAEHIVDNLGKYLLEVSVIVAAPASKKRVIQPVERIAKKVAALLNAQYMDSLLIKTLQTGQVKNLPERERVLSIQSSVKIVDVLEDGLHNILIIDDIYHTGSTLKAITLMLREYKKIKKIFVLTVTKAKG